MDIREHLKEHILIADGSFGMYYAEKYRTEESPELANTLHPERVRAIHREYIAAGAELIRTNTFASNTLVLKMPRESVSENISAAADIALECAGDSVFAAGDIGEMRGVSPENAAEEYVRAAEIFLGKGIYIINFESFSDTASLLPAMEKLRGRYGSDVFIMASFCVDRYGSSPSGRSAGRLMSEAAGLADCVGLNCGVGPVHMRGVLKSVSLPEKVFLSVLPNSGYPVLSRNQISFGNAAGYFGDKMGELAETGVNIVGGCCGTDPSYIEKTAEKLKGAYPANRAVSEKSGAKKTVHSGFIYGADGKLRKDKLIAAELVPPLDGDDEKLMESAHFLKNAGADVLTFPDSPSGRTRADSVLMAAKVRRETGMEVMPHICCRDKNALAIRSALMGAHINDIGNALMITGDPVPASARQSVKSVFNFDSVGLLKIASELNLDMFSERPICCGGAVNQNRRNIENEILRVKKKMAAGAEFFMSQPVFTAEDAERLRRIKTETGAFLLCGIMPLVSRRNALFMKNEISGVNVTDEIIARYPENGSKEEGEAAGIVLAKEVIHMVEDFADGYYFTFPFNRVQMLPAILGK
ncbi:MAG: bifunctional homocysteine S-methyltransferase/methylenetetrahydrofolate reductase [Oscillospiraceae bacterium]|nr:bifunctional homocysteine S-methyltransferase/methylenetetrahydrofolate reductase [Oscillospiraceae bacterium]MDY6209000.1 bifunctional homocysteine S-methyltransferase/methylenetetrahydrofolate reductase [Oscillospiraceae bacterium]